MAKLRHIALIVPDPEKAAKFFEEAFDMKVAGKARRGLYVSDGTMNVALLRQEGNEKVGIYHFGMWVDDLDEAEKKVVDAGGTYLEGRPAPAARGHRADRAFLLRGQVQGPARHRVRSHPYRLDRRREGRGGEELTARLHAPHAGSVISDTRWRRPRNTPRSWGTGSSACADDDNLCAPSAGTHRTACVDQLHIA